MKHSKQMPDALSPEPSQGLALSGELQEGKWGNITEMFSLLLCSLGSYVELSSIAGFSYLSSALLCGMSSSLFWRYSREVGMGMGKSNYSPS